MSQIDDYYFLASANLRVCGRIIHRAILLALLAWAIFSCSSRRPNLRRDILGLRDKDKQHMSEKNLRASGYAGMEELLNIGNAVGIEPMAAMALNSLKCPMALSMYFPSTLRAENRPLSFVATDFIIRWLQDDANMLHRFINSKAPLERTLGYIAISASPDSFMANRNFMEREDDSFAMKWGILMGFTCAMVRAKSKEKRDELRNAFRELAASLSEHFPDVSNKQGGAVQVSCRAPDFDSLDLLASLAKKEKLYPGGESWSNGVLYLSFSADGIKGSLGPACAMRLYNLAADHGKYLPWLLIPMVGQLGFTPHRTRTEAAGLLLRDLEKFPNEKQNEILAKAILAGGKSTRKVIFKESEYMPDYDLITAAAMQGDKKALDSIGHHFFCRGANSLLFNIQLLGFSKSAQAADQAYAFAEKCHGRATVTAFGALLRLRDSRTEQLFDVIIKSGYKYLGFDVIKTMAEVDSPVIRRKLEKNARAGDENAKTLIENIGIVKQALSHEQGAVQ